MRHDIMIDLESVIDSENPPAPPRKPLAEGEEPPFPSPIHWKIVSFGVGVLANHRLRSLKVIEGTEREQLLKFVGGVKSEDRLLTFNGRGFDLPLINHRCFHYGIPWPWYHGSANTDPKYRYKTGSHLDVMDYMADFGSLRRAPSMQALAKSIGLRGKGAMDGGDVAVAWGNDIKLVHQYCLEDVAQQIAIFLRVQLLRGEIDLETYQDAIDHWFNVAAESCPELVKSVNIDKLRLNQQV